MKTQIKWIVVSAFGLIIIFCTSFVFFYHRAQQQQAQAATAAASTGPNKPLPEANLVNIADEKLGDQTLRKGKVILVFVTADCRACDTEAQFLKTVVDKRTDVSFYGVISYGEKKGALEVANKIFPFKVFYDQDFRLTGKLGINRVPIKVFVEDGIIKKVWGGATTDEQAKVAFVQWLENLQ